MVQPLSHRRLREVLDYNPETGVFSRKIRRSSNAASGFINVHGYRVIGVDGRQYYAHRLAHLYMTGAWPEGEVDHVNGDRSDNRWSNLRDADKTTNLQNVYKARKDSRTGLKGVKPCDGKFLARITANGKGYSLGRFPTAEEAHAAYLRAKAVLHNGGLNGY